jgi:uncharacterized membrane protein SirB2
LIQVKLLALASGAMSAYLLAKTLHVGSVILSLGGFAVRGVLMLAGSPILEARFVRIAPHVVDTVLLGSALWLAWLLRQYPFVHGWLTAKVIGLIVYIVLGAIALRRGRTKAVRIAAFIGAVATAVYIVTVALTHDPHGLLLWRP